MDHYWEGFLPEPTVRTVGEMECVLADPDGTDLESDTPLYYMYRDLAMDKKDREILSYQKLRYDITVIPPAMLGTESVKTKGHYHPDAPSGTGYPELYQVLAGNAYYLLQRSDLSESIAVIADVGDSIFIPPGYGHITINPSETTLVMANVVSSCFSSEYEWYEKFCGGVYYYQKNDEWKLNDKYQEILGGSIPELTIVHANEWLNPFSDSSESIYNLAIKGESLLCLSEPERLIFAL